MTAKERICELVELKRGEYSSLSDEIWRHPELGYQEFTAVSLLKRTLAENNFVIEDQLAGIETSFKAVWGKGEPVIGFLGEYDALAGLSQKAMSTEKEPVEVGGNGHGCGHNALGVGSMAAAIGLKEYMEEVGLKGTIVYYGCPAEEMGCGKAFMVREGVFTGTDVALTWHSFPRNLIIDMSMLANMQVEFKFRGVSAHAANMPEKGRSALDASELMNVGVNFLREHVIQEARIHYAFLNAGGKSPNVVQDSAGLLYYIRAPKSEQVKEIYERICKIAKGAAMMTETECEIEIRSAMTEYIPNDVLGRVGEECWKEIGACPFSEKAKELAEKISKVCEAEVKGDVLMQDIPDYHPQGKCLSGSSDMGDVSHVVPILCIFVAGLASNTPTHSWQVVSQTYGPLAHDSMIHAAKILAYIGVKILEHPEIAEKAKEELMGATGGKNIGLMPDSVQPRSIF